MAVIFGAYTCASSIPTSIPSQTFSLQYKLYSPKSVTANPQNVYYTLAEYNWAASAATFNNDMILHSIL